MWTRKSFIKLLALSCVLLLEHPTPFFDNKGISIFILFLMLVLGGVKVRFAPQWMERREGGSMLDGQQTGKHHMSCSQIENEGWTNSCLVSKILHTLAVDGFKTRHLVKLHWTFRLQGPQLWYNYKRNMLNIRCSRYSACSSGIIHLVVLEPITSALFSKIKHIIISCYPFSLENMTPKNMTKNIQWLLFL